MSIFDKLLVTYILSALVVIFYIFFNMERLKQSFYLLNEDERIDIRMVAGFIIFIPVLNTYAALCFINYIFKKIK